MSVDKIKEYCRRLDKHSEDKTVLKDTLYKLNKMAVTVDILQKTGIGKVVNSIKHRGGKTGDIAADLIKKWRNVVDREAEQEQEEGKYNNNNNNNNNNHQEHTSKTGSKRDSHRRHESKSASKRESSSSRKKSEKTSKDRHSGASGKEPALFSDLLVVGTKPTSKQSKSNLNQNKKLADSRSRSNKKDEKKESPRVESPASSSSSIAAESALAEGSSAAVESKPARASAPDVVKQPARKKRKAPQEEEEDDGMNANFGSFEECIGSFEPKSLKKKKKKVRSLSSPKMTVTSSTLNGSSSKPKGPRLPDSVDKKPIDLLDLNLPRPSYDYKSLARFEPKPQALVKRPPTMDEGAQFYSSRKDRTAVYSGRRNITLTSVPTLFDACIRVLVDHVDNLHKTGGVPYSILKPVLERCTWQQLYTLEYHNPYLTEDSEPLWEVHCRKDFRNKAPAAGEESWKELYLRCHDEREQKLKILTASISQSMKDKQMPVRTTKLAYVDSIAKAPRNVQKAQMRNGTFIGNKAEPSQARRIASQAATSAAVDAVRAPSTAAPKKPKVAPLMAKTLSFLKMRKNTGFGFASR